MKKNILPTSAICFILTLAAFGQTPSVSPTPSYSDSDATGPQPPPAASSHHNEKPRTIDEMKALAKASKTKDDLVFAYDKFRDESIVTSKPENIVGSWEGAAAIMASSPRYGAGPGTPRLLMVALEWRFAGTTMRESADKFLLTFDGMSPDWQFLKTGSTLFVLFDGDQRMQLEAVAHDHDVVRRNRVDEAVAYVITRDQAARLARAAKVEVRIGDAKPREIKPKILKRWQAVLDATQLEAEK